MTAPEAVLDLLAALTNPVGRWGDKATEDQWSDAEAILSMDGPRRHWLGHAKGYSKTRDVAALSLVALLTQFLAGERDSSPLPMPNRLACCRESMAAFVNNTPELKRAREDRRPQGVHTARRPAQRTGG